jgi:hypothetical protein
MSDPTGDRFLDADNNGVPDLAPDPEKVWSPKVIAAGVASFLVPAILATIAYIVSNPDTLPIDNPILGVLVFAILTSAATTLSAYLKRDPLRR